ncbi:MAG: hypothetical protein EOP06_05075, partial [Proteobacteria bacterium]
MKLCIFLMAVMMGSAAAGTLNQWLAEKIQQDEQLLVEALAMTGGHSLDRLKDAKTYVPFFLEAPKGVVFASAEQKEAFETWMKDSGQGFLSGGYVYRLRFKAAPPLYAMSSGEWDGNAWHNIALGRDVTVEPKNLWESSDGDYLYATLLGGVPPRLVIYDQNGEIARQESFDAFAADFEQRLETAIAPYSSSGKPILEMISLAEYLQQPKPSWRAVDTSGQFNLRNQHQRADEQERLKQIGPLTRSAAVSALIGDTVTTQQTTPTPRPPSIVQ